MNLNDFKPCDRLVITYRNRNGEERRAAEVTVVNYNNNGLVTYGGLHGTELMPTGQGAFDPETVGAKPFGIVKVEKVGRVAPWRPFTPRPGDRAYDSVH